MLRGIVGSCVQYRFLVLVGAVALLLFGSIQLGGMPVDVLPEFSPVFVEVQTEALGLSANEVEMLVTLNVEELLMGTPWVQVMRSQSVPGLSSILLIFEPGTDMMTARQMVQERLNLAWGLPNVSKPPIILQPLSATSRVMMVGLSSQEVSPIAMSVLARWNIRPALMGVEGVANVSIWGFRDRQLQVQVDPEVLRANDLTLDQIVQTAGDALWVSPLTFLNASTTGPGGWIDTPQQRITVRHLLPISEAKDLAQVVVAGTGGLRLLDVAEVVEDHQPLIGDAVLDDGPGLLLVIEKFPGANALEVTRSVEAELESLQPGLAGIEIDSTIFRPATFIEMALGNLSTTLLISSILVVVALGFLFYDWRVALISAVSIPLSLVAALYVLYLGGSTANAMVLGGLVMALGAIMDDAIVDLANIARRLRQPREPDDERSPVTIILEASAEMRGTLIFGTLIAALAVVPIFFVEESSGLFYRPLAVSYLLALLAATVVALAVTPALSAILLSRGQVTRRQFSILSWIQRVYERTLSRSMASPRVAYVAFGVLAAAALAAVPFLTPEPLPEFKEGDLMIQWEAAPGTSHPAMTRLAGQVGSELLSLPGVRNFAAHVGRAVLGDQVVGINSADLWVGIDPGADDYDETVASIREVVQGYPGLVSDVRTYLQDTLNEVSTGSNQDMVVRIYGREFGDLQSTAGGVARVLSGIKGVVGTAVEAQIEEPYVEIEVDLSKADEYGVKPGDVRRAASTLLGGIHVGSLFEEQKVFDVVVWGSSDTRQSLTSVRELLIDIPGGGHVRLEDVADVRVASALTNVNREAISRRIDVGLSVRGRRVGAVARDVESALKQISFPRETRAQLLGDYAERRAAQQRILVAAIAAAIGIYLLLQAPLDSWRLAGMVLITMPGALSGGVLAAAFVGDGVISLGELAGLVTLLGIVARNAIKLVCHYQAVQEQAGETLSPELILSSSKDGVTSMAMMILTLGLALLPFAILGDIPGLELAHPIAVVVLGGLVTTILYNLFVLPSLYLRLAPGRKPAMAGSQVPETAEA